MLLEQDSFAEFLYPFVLFLNISARRNDFKIYCLSPSKGKWRWNSWNMPLCQRKPFPFRKYVKAFVRYSRLVWWRLKIYADKSFALCFCVSAYSIVLFSFSHSRVLISKTKKKNYRHYFKWLFVSLWHLSERRGKI